MVTILKNKDFERSGSAKSFLRKIIRRASKTSLKEDLRDTKTAEQCLTHLCMSEHLSDVSFTFTSDPNVKLPAHKFILSMRSTVFETMFYGPMARSCETITIDDLEPETMKFLLGYMYSDQSPLTGNNVLACLYAAKKYALHGLEMKCSLFLEKNITADTVCSIYEQAVFFDVENLQTRCFNYMLTNACEVFESQDFLNVSQTTLFKLLQNDNLADDETHVFKACLKWSKHQCRSQNLQLTPENQRAVLGDALFKIRFPLMTMEMFAKTVAASGILTNDEQDMIRYIATGKLMPRNRFVCKERTVTRFTKTKPKPKLWHPPTREVYSYSGDLGYWQEEK